MKNKRKYPRFGAALYIVGIVPTTPPDAYKARLLEVSKGGLKLSTDHFIKNGTDVILVSKLPKRKSPLIASARKIWSRKIGEATYEMGMRFTKIPRKDLDKLLKYAMTIINRRK